MTVAMHQLTELFNGGGHKETMLAYFNFIFEITHQGCILSTENKNVLNQMALLVISIDLREVLIKIGGDGYAFQFAALQLINIDDVIKDLLNYGRLFFVLSNDIGVKLQDQLLGPVETITFFNKEQPGGKENEVAFNNLKEDFDWKSDIPSAPPAYNSYWQKLCSYWQKLRSYWPW